MEGGVPLVGLNKRCALAAVDGLSNLAECRMLAGQVYQFITASGGELVDHRFVQLESDHGLRIWACRDDPVSFIASLRAALRCLVDTPERLQAATRRPHRLPRVQVSVALAPARDPICPVVLATLAAGAEVGHVARDLCAVALAGASLPPNRADPALALWATRAESVAPGEHLRRVLLSLGVPASEADQWMDEAVRVSSIPGR
ncbi:MAG: hypothetical protein MUE46_12435 [Xanthomonadales bacterium]|jgi:hypothetical protein|nr:hypothetical protein [Xanthomonadales bacterium]